MTNDKVNDNFIRIPESKEQLYLARLLKDINDGFVANVFLNKQLKYKSFRLQLIEFLEDKVDLHKTLSLLDTETMSTLLFSMVRQDFCDMLTLLLSEEVNVNCTNLEHVVRLADPLIFTPLHVASENGYIDTVIILLKHKANVDIICGMFETSYM
ncbi:unnamed protein product [Mytilus edulis]|uniref:Uncharacterized protein n=1 Tax=Mytilus edulis TaxID=6550 RepID=A0A8S3TUX3_MYTED|nr:unnamed protein product [Mytilus edulis]